MRLNFLNLASLFGVLLIIVAATLFLGRNVSAATSYNRPSFDSSGFKSIHDPDNASMAKDGVVTSGEPSLQNSRIPAPAISTSASFTSYLPLIYTPIGEIYGTVTANGEPVEGVSLKLWEHCISRADYENWVVGEVLTDAFGIYRINAGSIPFAYDEYGGWCFAYSVTYQNPSATSGNGKLAYYETHDLSSYTCGSEVKLEDFDISDVVLQSPEDLSNVPFPITFSWVPRPGLSSDNYYFQIREPNYLNGSFYSSNLGYSNSFTFDSLPVGFSYDFTYYWKIEIIPSSGGYGYSYTRRIHFRY